LSRLTRLGIASAPTDAVTQTLRGVLNLWSYNYADPINSLRDRTTQLLNACDDMFARYSAHLQEDLHRLRQALPQPTREKPFPPMDDLQSIKELEKYIRDIEALRVKIRSASVPPMDIVSHGHGDNRLYFAELEAIDQDLLMAATNVTDESLPQVVRILDLRNEKIRTLFIS
jgi:hypothetical protein